MKERLTERADGTIYCKDTYDKIIDRLAEYEDLEEQGLLVRLPCKVGDTCYFTKIAEEYELLCGQVRSICIDNDGIWFSCRCNDGLSYWLNSKKMFFSYAEAEKKLEELKEKKNGISNL